MIRVRWLPSAVDALEEIVDFIGEDDPAAAMALADRIISAVDDALPNAPYMGRPGRVTGTRELVVHRRYIVVYAVTPDAVTVLDIIHTARLYPPGASPD